MMASASSDLNATEGHSMHGHLAWQIPMGNTIMAACNNTQGHYMDNRPEYWLEDYPKNTHILEWARAGFIGLLFGRGAGEARAQQQTRAVPRADDGRPRTAIIFSPLDICARPLLYSANVVIGNCKPL
jgi:hypothetical protein